MIDLEIISTEELVDELLRRFHHAAFCGVKVSGARESLNEYTYWWNGCSHTVVGLCADLSQMIIDEFKGKKNE